MGKLRNEQEITDNDCMVFTTLVASNIYRSKRRVLLQVGLCPRSPSRQLSGSWSWALLSNEELLKS